MLIYDFHITLLSYYLSNYEQVSEIVYIQPALTNLTNNKVSKFEAISFAFRA